jgi:hypothetical protein
MPVNVGDVSRLGCDPNDDPNVYGVGHLDIQLPQSQIGH